MTFQVAHVFLRPWWFVFYLKDPSGNEIIFIFLMILSTIYYLGILLHEMSVQDFSILK